MRAATRAFLWTAVLLGCGSDPLEPDVSAPSPDGTRQCIDVWSRAGTPAVRRDTPFVAALIDGRVLVTGGASLGSATGDPPDAEIFDPASNAWVSTPPLNGGPGWPYGAVLENGAVLVGGGAGPEMFDPATGTWSVVDPLNDPDLSPVSAVRITTGEVLIVAKKRGRDPREDYLSELFDLNARWNVAGSVPRTSGHGRLDPTPEGGAVLVNPPGSFHVWNRAEGWNQHEIRVPVPNPGWVVHSGLVSRERLLAWDGSSGRSAIADLRTLQWTEGPQLPKGAVRVGTTRNGLLLETLDPERRPAYWLVRADGTMRPIGRGGDAYPSPTQLISTVADRAVDLQDGPVFVVAGGEPFIVDLCD